jgi:hypothetical protein
MKHLALLAALWPSLSWGTRHVAAQVMAGQTSDFEQGGTQGWQEGGLSPNPPQVVASGGPNGADDAFLENRSSGSGGAGGRMVFFNSQAQWRGNYLDAGITALEVDFNNTGSSPLTMRFRLLGPGRDVFTPGFLVAPGSGWQHASFSLDPEQLEGSGNILTTLGNVSQLWLIHNTAPVDPGPFINAVLGIDNVRAVGPMVEELPGDYNDSGVVEQADLDLVLLNWGGPSDPPPAGWAQDLPMGTIDQAELDGVLLNWGNTSAPPGSTSLAPTSNATLPEPSTLLLTGAGLLVLYGGRSRFRVA